MKISLLALSALLASQVCFAGGSSTVGPANPAAKYCLSAGGKSVAIKAKDGGEGGLCIFGKRAAIEEWTLFRYKFAPTTSQPSRAVQALLYQSSIDTTNGGTGAYMPNPASRNCQLLGGKSVSFYLSNQSEVSLCEFTDSSIIEEWTLFRGANSKENRGLVKVLKK